MTTEIRPIPGLADYGASEDGRIWRISRVCSRSGYILKRAVPYELVQMDMGRGNMAVTMPRLGTKEYTKRAVAQLVALTWLAPPSGHAWRAFQKDTRAGYAASNLEWR